MNKKFFILFVIILIASITFVSAQSDDSTKSAPDYSTADSLILHKSWSGDDSSFRPDSISVRVFADEKLLETVTITENDEWVYDSGRLLFPINNTDGSKVIYTFEEVGVDNYTLTYTENSELNFTLTNTYTENTSDNSTGNTLNSTDSTTSKNPVKDNTTKNTASKTNKNMVKNKTPVKHTTKYNITTTKLLKTGNNIWVVVVCVIIIAVTLIYIKR